MGLELNERADQIATNFADGLNPLLYNGSLQSYTYKEGLVNLEQKIEQLKASKSKKRQSSKKAAYSYVSLVDGKIGIHNTWVECEVRVKESLMLVSRKFFQKKKNLNSSNNGLVISVTHLLFRAKVLCSPF